MKMINFKGHSVCGFILAALFILMTLTADAATFTVTNLNDSGFGSLRQAILDSNANANGPGVVDVIEFQFGLTGQISLTSADLVITDDLNIQGPGAGMLTVSGNNAWRIFEIKGGGEIVISGLRIADGNGVGTESSGVGGAILIASESVNVELNDCMFEDNTVTRDTSTGIITNGALYVSMVVNRCAFTNNSTIATTGFAAGGVFGGSAPYFSVEVNDSTFTSNSAQSGTFGSYGGVLLEV